MRAALAHQMQWSEEDYLGFERDSLTKHEYLDGEVYAMAGARTRHNIIAANVLGALVALLRGSGCKGFTSDQRIRVEHPKTFYTYADAGVACGQRWRISPLDRMSLENPVLLIEVLSRTTREYDRGTKLFLYQQIPSLEHVLLIDQPAHLIEHYQRGARGWDLTLHRQGSVKVPWGEIALSEIYDVPEVLEDDEE